MIKKNIYSDINIPENDEIFDIIQKTENTVIERIVSSDTLQEKEYIQDHDEWVLLLKGRSEILLNEEKIILAEGDYLFIEKGVPHRVMSADKGTVWLAIHVYGKQD